MQILDELVIPRPCIDMEDEGYNVEWSQELKLEDGPEVEDAIAPLRRFVEPLGHVIFMTYDGRVGR